MKDTNAAELMQDGTGRIYLNLPNSAYKSRRCIGQIAGDELRCFRDCNKHYFRALRAYGFAYDLLSRAKYRVLVLSIHDGLEHTGTIYISRNKALQRLQILNFKKNGLEKQAFVRLNEFYSSREEALEWDATNAVKDVKKEAPSSLQLGLFS
jgi:hypothetical protein